MQTQVREIISDVEIVGGTPVFAGTRVPFDGLIEYIEAGETIDDFVRDFPTVTREQAARALEEAAMCTEELVSESSAQ